MLPFSADRAMVAKFDAAIAPFMNKVGTMSDGVRRFQVQSQIGFSDIDARANRTGQALMNLRSVAAGLGTVVGAGVAALASGAFVSLADDAKLLANQMRGIGIETEDLQKKVYALAIETRTPVQATVELLARMQKSLRDQPIEQTIRQVGTLNRLLAIGGLDGAARASVSLQFGQALQSGVLQGDELRSLREAAPYELLDAIAKAAGGTVAELRTLGEQGKLTRRVMIQALDDLEKASKEKFGNFNMTVGEAAETMRTGLLAVVGELDQGLGATDAMAGAMQKVAQFMLDNAGAAEVLGQALKIVAQTALLLAGTRGLLLIGTAAVSVGRSLTMLTGITAGTAAGLRGLMALMGGPWGLAVFAAGAAYMTYSAKAEAAQERTAQVNAELERMGLYTAPGAASGIDKAGEAVERLADPERLARIKALREEKERLESGGRDIFGRAGKDTAIGIYEEAQHQADYGWMVSDYESRDKSALREIQEMALAVHEMRAETDDVLAFADRIAAMDISDPAKQLAAELAEIAKRMAAIPEGLNKAGEAQYVLDQTNERIRANVAQVDLLVAAMKGIGLPKEVTGEVLSLTGALIEGQIEAEEAQKDLQAIADAHPAAGEYIARLSKIFSALDRLMGLAAAARAALNDVASSGFPGDPSKGPGFEDRGRSGSTLPPYVKPAPTLDDLIKRDTKGGGGGGGGAGRDDWADTVKSIREETEALEAQARAYEDVAKSGQAYGNATEYARRKAELLTAAQRAGKEITPELIAEIDALALAYATAGQSAEEAADKLAQIEEASERGEDALASLFGSILDGSDSARDAVASLLKEIAKIQFAKGLLGLLGMTSWGGGLIQMIGNLTAHADGGVMTARGPLDLPMRAYASGGIANSPQLALFGEGSMAEAYVPLPDGRSIPVTLRMPDLSGMEAAMRERAAPQVIYVPQPYVAQVAADDDGKIMARMQQIGDQSAARMGQQINQALPARVQQINANPRRR